VTIVFCVVRRHHASRFYFWCCCWVRLLGIEIEMSEKETDRKMPNGTEDLSFPNE
jgi:hypothetical protein